MIRFLSRILCLLTLACLVMPCTAQESLCQDGIDNDGDGFIDCSDSDCSGSMPCATAVTDCTYFGDNFSFTVAGSSVPGYTDEFILTDLNGLIQAVSSTNGFANVTAGDYQLFHLNYADNEPITGNQSGQFIGNITGECFEVSGGFTIKVCTGVACQINLGLWLEGAYEEATAEMKTSLNDHQLLPGQKPFFFLGTETPVGQPYSAAPWNYGGQEGDNYDYQLTGEPRAAYPPEVVDWVLVSLRSDMTPQSTVYQKAVWLLADGTISFPMPCDYALPVNQSLFVVVEHRNHLPVMTATAVPVTADGIAYDFRVNQSYISFLGDGQKLLGNGQYAMFTANGDQSSLIQSVTDINSLDESIWTQMSSMGDAYLQGDYNLDGDVNAADEVYWLENTGKSSDVSFE